MPQDLPRLVQRTLVLVQVSEELCSGSMRAIQKSKRLLETIDAERGSQQNAQPLRRSQPAKLDSPGCRKNQ